MGHIGFVSSTSDYAERLRLADLRVTRPRIAVLEAVHAHPHADTETIFPRCANGLPDVSHQAVYDVLNALTAVGLVRRIQPSGLGRALRVPRRRQPPPRRVPVLRRHRRRRLRGRRGALPDPVGRRRRSRGFVLDEAEVIYWGICPDCSTADFLITARDHSPITHHRKECCVIRYIRRRPPTPKRDASNSESENPAIASPKPKVGRSADEPGLVARADRRVGAARALAARATRSARTSTTPRNSPSSTSRRSRPT